MIRQFVRFYAVGTLGAGVQLVMLRFCTQGLGVQYVIATLLAVETALLHNFVWHEMWTWSGLPWKGWPVRLMRFQLGNGVASLAANAGLTFAFHEFVRIPVLGANVAAILSAALLNFGLAKFWVFRSVSPGSEI
jgi:putative flippase GtrA